MEKWLIFFILTTYAFIKLSKLSYWKYQCELYSYLYEKTSIQLLKKIIVTYEKGFTINKIDCLLFCTTTLILHPISVFLKAIIVFIATLSFIYTIVNTIKINEVVDQSLVELYLNNNIVEVLKKIE